MPRLKSARQSQPQSGFEPAFEARESYDFADEPDLLENDMNEASYNPLDGGVNLDLGDFAMFENGSTDALGAHSGSDSYSMNAAFSRGMTNVDPSAISQKAQFPNTNFAPGAHQYTMSAKPQSALDEIVSKREDSVREQYGQITPPDDDREGPKSKEDIAKENRTQRARNAANKRHSKGKKRKDTAQDEEGEVVKEEEDPGKTTTLQKEKNRVAAAKCRAKKKATSEEMQDVHREESRRHSFLQKEVRDLREQKAFLRNTLLQHEPGMCRCHAIHRFNMAQAQQVAMGVGAMIQPMSPSHGSDCSLLTPVSAGPGRRKSSSAASGAGALPTEHSNEQDLERRMMQGFSQEDMQMQMQHDAGQSMSQMPQFSDFLSGSPQGHGFHELAEEIPVPRKRPQARTC